jgi:hypothetical protein
MQLVQERQARRGLVLFQQQDDRIVRLLHAAAERFVVLDVLPMADALLTDQQHKRGGLGDFLREFRQPKPTSLQTFRRKENVGAGILLSQRRFQRLHQRLVLRVVA